MADAERWWAKGLLFENCNCQLLCPAHLSFKQRCEHERCIGHWAIHIDQGEYGALRLDGLSAFIISDSPQLMISGGWTQAIYIDEGAGRAERRALEQIFTGQAGGPWAVLANVFNQIHATTQVLALGATRFRDRGLALTTSGTHALYSRFSWAGP